MNGYIILGIVIFVLLLPAIPSIFRSIKDRYINGVLDVQRSPSNNNFIELVNSPIYLVIASIVILVTMFVLYKLGLIS